MKPRLDEIYAKNPEGRDTGIENTTCNLETYFQFMRQELGQPQSLSIPMIIYKAEKTDTGLTENPEFDWPCEPLKTTEIKASDHFSIFKKQAFANAIKTEINDIQPIASDIPLQKRLAVYLERKRQALTSIEQNKTLQLSVSRHPIPKTELELASEILNNEDNHKTIVLCGEPGSGKSTTLKSLEISAINKKLVPVFIKLKEYYSPTTITEKLLQIGLNLQEIATTSCTNLIFFLDGFDEIDNKTALLEITPLLKPLGRIIISTRTQVYESVRIQSGQFFGSHQRYDLNPLTENQIKLFLDNENDFSFIKQYSELLELCKNPLTLSLIKKILPEIQRGEQLQGGFNRFEIYCRFIKKLYSEKEVFVREEHGIRPRFDIQHAFEQFNRQLSLAAWKLKSKPHLSSLMTEHHVSQADVTESHETFIEYFIANIVFEEILSKDFYTLSKINFTEKNSFVDFLCERIQNQPFEYYIKFIHLLMTELQLTPDAQTSSNIGTLLTKLEVPFSNLSLREINLSGADLSGGIFYGTDFEKTLFQGTNVSHANFAHSSCENANFYKANFGQYPSVTFDTIYVTAAMLLEREPNEPLLCAIAYKNHTGTTQIDIRRTHEGMHVKKLFSVFTQEEGDINHLTISPKNFIAYVKNQNELYIGEAEIYPIQEDIYEDLSEDYQILTTPQENFLSSRKIYPYNDDRTPIVELNLGQNNDIIFYTQRACYQYNHSSNNLIKIKNINHPIKREYKLFCISRDLTKIAYAVTKEDEETKKYKCLVYNIDSTECIFESDYTEEISELFFTKKNGFLCVHVDDTDFFDDKKQNRLVFIDVLIKKEVYETKRLPHACHTHISDDMSIVLAISYDEREYKHAAAKMPETTFEFELLPKEFNKPVFQRKINPKQSTASPKFHPQLPIIMYCSNPQQIQLQYLTSKNTFCRLNLPFEIICIEAYKENIYILGVTKLSVWKYENHTLLNIFNYTFDDHNWHGRETDTFIFPPETQPTFVFFSNNCFSVFDSQHIFYFKEDQVFKEYFKKNIHWIHFLNEEKLLMGLSSDKPMPHIEQEQECESELTVFEWQPSADSKQERLYIRDYCEKSIASNRAFKLIVLDNYLDTLTVLGGAGRKIYRYHSKEDYEEIGHLPGLMVLQIAPSLFASFYEDKKSYGPPVVKIFRLLSENEANDFSDAPEDNSFSDSPEDNASDDSSSSLGPLIKEVNQFSTYLESFYYGDDTTVTWQPLLQLLMIYSDEKIQIWHIDIEDNCSSTLVYHSENALCLEYINTKNIKTDGLNKKILEDAGLDHKIYLSDCEEYGIEKPKPKQFERSSKLLDVLTDQDKSLPLSTIHWWLAIFNQLSYADRLAVSAVSKKYYAIANHIEISRRCTPLLSSPDMLIVQKIVSAYIKQLLINLMSFPLDKTTDLEIKPSKIAPQLLTVGFFSAGKKHIWDYPVKLLEKTSYFP
ncbi:MAG: pentapeptide repeat-containing protein [Gammaproteobacteria bacterium]|nr:pentapeptide repeat-containing protein [Gammaproteobacteria bacterium]